MFYFISLHKRNYRLDNGDCSDEQYKILAFEVKAEAGDLFLRLPPPEELDALIGSSKWMVRKATAELMDRVPSGETKIEIVGPNESADEDKMASSSDCGSGAQGSCGGAGGAKLEW